MERKLFVSWVRATSLGWLLGIPLIAALALVGETVGIGGAQVIVGAGMGAAIGLMQARALRGLLDRRSIWVGSCVAGLGCPFLATDLSNLAGWSFPYSLAAFVAIGGLLAGIWQALILRRRFSRTGSWVVASALGWSFAAGAVAASDFLFTARVLEGILGAVIYLGCIACGGLVLGLPTGACIAWMLKRERSGMESLDERIQRAVREEISIAPHDPAWRDSFQREKEHLLSCLPGGLIRRRARSELPIRH